MAKLTMLRPAVRTMDVRSVRPAPKAADRFYSSSEWTEMRDRVRREARGRCQREGCSERGLYVDHIVELKDGGAPLDRENLELLCASHHQEKTQRQRAKRAGFR